MWSVLPCVIIEVLNMMEALLPGSSPFTKAEEKRTQKVVCQLLNSLVVWVTQYFAYGLLTRTSRMVHFTTRKWGMYGNIWNILIGIIVSAIPP